MSADKLQKIQDELSSLTLVEAAELAKMLKEAWGVEDAPAFVAAAGAPAAGGEAAPAEEKSSFNVVATGFESKLPAIKVVKELVQGLNLTAAKELVEKIAEGAQTIAENVAKEEAETMKKKLEEAGVKVELK